MSFLDRVPDVNKGPIDIVFEAVILPLSRVSVEPEKLFCICTELLLIVTAAFITKLPDTLRVFGVLIVKVPVIKSWSASIRELNPDPERIKLGVALVVIELVKTKLPDIVIVCPDILFQFAVLLDIKDKLDKVEVKREILAPPVFVT